MRNLMRDYEIIKREIKDIKHERIRNMELY